jgi:predicted DNA-binding transcriptional regulator YafY
MSKAPSVRRDRQVVRILGLLKLLIEGGRPTIYELAARYKVRRETIYQDLHALDDIGYPIAGDESGRLSRPRLAADGRPAIPPVPFTRQEVAALVWAVKEAGARQPFRSALGTAVPKLQALLPAKDGRLGMALDGALGGWTRGVKDYSSLEPTILRLVEGIIGRSRCRVTYQAPGQQQARTYPFDPYRLLSVQGGLYCVGRVPAYRDIITLAVDRIRALDVTGETFTVDPAFDAKRYEAEAFGIVWEKPMTVVVRFRADQAPYVREREWHPTQKLRDLRDGRVELTFRAGGSFEITRWILGWGDAAEVVRPPALRREIVSILRRAATTYRRAVRPTQRRGPVR